MKQHQFTIALLFSVLSLVSLSSAKTWYLSPSGNDQNDGLSSANAKFSLQLVVDAAQSGDSILLKGGTYKYDTTITISKSGTADGNIYIGPLTGEKPVLDFSSYDVKSSEKTRAYARGLLITGDYWYMKKIEVCNAPDNGIKVEGSHNTFDQCIFHHNNDSGIQIGFWKEGKLVDNTSGEKCAYNLVINCDSYRNADETYYGGGSPYENADGFACKLYAGKGNVFRGCRAWENCDDGWDFYMTNFEIRVENCWSYHNGDPSLWGKSESGWNGDGNGFKLGGDKFPSPNIIINSIAFDAYFGAKCGFNSNNNGMGIRVYNCVAWHCGKNFKLVDQAHELKNCLAFDPVSGKNFNADITMGKVISQNNSWDLTGIMTPDYDDLISTRPEDFLAPRQADGSLPNNGFGRPKAGSDCIDKGVNVGLPYAGSAPDLGAYEYGAVANRIIPLNRISIVNNRPANRTGLLFNLAGSRIPATSTLNNVNLVQGPGVHIMTIHGTAASKFINIK